MVLHHGAESYKADQLKLRATLHIQLLVLVRYLQQAYLKTYDRIELKEVILRKSRKLEARNLPVGKKFLPPKTYPPSKIGLNDDEIMVVIPLFRFNPPLLEVESKVHSAWSLVSR